MPHETDIIATITAAVVAGAIAGHLAALVRMPPVLGFLLAGVAVGPFTPGPIADSSIANQLAEFGIILLMFGVGIHFSLRDMRVVLRIVLPAATAQVIILALLVAGLLSLWGWGLGTGLLMGVAISIASTVIVVHAFDRRGERDSMHGRVAVGWLVIEDLLTVLVLILVPLLAVEGSERSLMTIVEAVGLGIAEVVVLSIGLLVIGARVVPRLLLLTARLNSRELRLVTVLALALGIAYGAATFFDVSFALGAFLAGLVVSEADVSHQAAADALPLQDAFSALFFVSVGMLFDPGFLLEEPVLVVVIVLLILVAKPAVSQLLLSALHFPERPALLISASRAQIGEFSFILASLGLAEGIFDEDQVSLILAGSIISILLNPWMFSGAERLAPHVPTRLRLVRLPFRPFAIERGSEAHMRGHAIVLGGGRVGQLIISELRQRDIPVIVVDYHRNVVEAMRAAGIPAVYGDVANPSLMRYLDLPNARALVVAISDEIAARLTVERAHILAPDLPVVVRTHTDSERAYLGALPNTEAVMGERELAIEMASYVLSQFGLSQEELFVVRQDLRSRPEESTKVASLSDV